MTLFLDTSALVELFHVEEGTECVTVPVGSSDTDTGRRKHEKME
jgi:hypothetical protein